jgi:hypothetical protein
MSLSEWVLAILSIAWIVGVGLFMVFYRQY